MHEINIDELVGQICPLYTCCIICGQTKLTKDFVRSIKNDRKFKIRDYCSDCLNKYDANQISQMIQRFKAGNKDFILSQDFRLLGDNQVVTLKGGYIIKEIDVDTAKRYLDDAAAYFFRDDPSTVYLRFSNRKELTKYVLDRDHHACFYCGKTAEYVEKIKSKLEGGLKTPSNMRSVCEEHRPYVNGIPNKPIKSLTLPIYINGEAEIKDYLQEPTPHTFELKNHTDRVYCYCDISTFPGSKMYGISNVFTGADLEGVQVYTTIMVEKPEQTHLAEMRAIQRAVDIIHGNGWGKYKCFVLTDVNYHHYLLSSGVVGSLAKKIEKKRGNIGVRTLTHEEQKKNQLYVLAHQYSRKVMREFRRNEMQ